MSHTQNGFTLIELLVVVAIIAKTYLQWVKGKRIGGN
ncbi:MAG: prepilin-type N-terminal cleavage/methylation domain-containing protein [Planctomycetota bacterium]